MSEEFLKAETLGRLRCRAEHQEGTTVVRERNAWDRDGIAQRQLTALSPGDLAFYNLELLHRAETLVNFLEDNVGSHTEFPVRLRAQNAQTKKHYDDAVEDLKIIVGLLLES